MKLKSISLANFRGFEQVDFSFEDDVNVIAGENGIGKSSVLCVLATILSHAVRDTTPARSSELKFSDADVRFGSESLIASAKMEVEGKVLDYSIRRSLENREKTNTLVNELSDRLNELRKVEGGNKRDREKEQAKIQRNIVSLKRTLTEGEDILNLIVSGMDVTPAVDDSTAQTRAEKAFMAGLRNREGQPVAVYYSTKRFFNDEFKSIPKTRPFTIAKAYSNALEDLDVSLKEFAHWFHFASESEKGVRIAGRMVEVISEFIPEFSNLRLSDKGPLRFLVDKGGATLQLTQLSDGERGLLAMVFDLTRRLSLANPESENPIAEGKAIVLIDEVELHLHPKWQREVLRRLESTFENCQFIATTHSPQIIGEVESRGVKLFYKREGKILAETPGMAFGADSNWILDVLMDADDQNAEVEQAIGEISKLLAEKNLESAAKKIAALRDTIGNTAAIQRAASSLDRIRLLGK
ncbi:AAA family ATPase [Arenicella xantha]|uniref:Putative ATP-binding protein involved in virulence n=1 Tax=Arenicella xantha TaxID=644221 RepID=A0A395JMM0_9GAMM|nr:AAA family ATPase [Arenicella xantha]RBP52901.1 putative ATP-binding protein involved in virulence [Arenicella xantha]